jgi:hypothetical protein
MSAYVSIRLDYLMPLLHNSIREHTRAYVSIRLDYLMPLLHKGALSLLDLELAHDYKNVVANRLPVCVFNLYIRMLTYADVC